MLHSNIFYIKSIKFNARTRSQEIRQLSFSDTENDVY